MPKILKFRYKDSVVSLDKWNLEDISNDIRTKAADKSRGFVNDYNVDKNAYMVCSDTAFKLAKFFSSKPVPDAMLIREGEKSLIIVPLRSLVFWNGKSIEPSEYKTGIDEQTLLKRITKH